MGNHTENIRKFVKFLNNEEEQGGFWLPNIQRPFVWKEEQIERLYDSILREYPIGTLLIWKTKSNIKRRKFIDNYKKNIPLSTYFVPQDKTQKMMVLDGQQRLQALYIGLKGSYGAKELYLDIFSGELVAPEDIKFTFKFLKPENAKFPFIKFKDLVMTDRRAGDIGRKLKREYTSQINTENDEIRLEQNLELVKDVFCTKESILYQLVDSIDRPEIYSEDDIVEIFIRANSGGTQLAKSDLLFSLLTASWEDAEEKIDELISQLNKTGYKFNRDFILKTCLILLGRGSKYEIKKFRDPTLKTEIESKWIDISNSIKAVKDFVYGNTYLKTDKTLPSYLSLIPLIYSNYHYPFQWNDKLNDFAKYLLKVNLTGVFGGASESFSDSLINSIKDNKGFVLSKLFDLIKSKGKTMEMNKANLFGLHYNSKEIHLLFNLWYGFNYQPALKENKPQIDHIFPQSELKKIKKLNPETGRNSLMKYKANERDQLANLMLLTAKENGMSGKTNILPKVWFEDKSEEYLEKHLIPRDKQLWQIDRFEEFLNERKKLILQKFKDLVYDNESIEEEE